MMRQVLFDYLLNAAWQLPLLAAGGWVVSQAARLPQRRAWMASGLLVLALVLPLHVRLALPGLGTEAAGAFLGRSPATAPIFLPTPPLLIAAAVPSDALAVAPALADVLLIAAALAVAAAALRLGLGLAAARRLVERAQPAALSGPAVEALQRFCARHRMRPPRVLASAEIASPVTVGVFEPVILTPPDFACLPPDEARAAILHEAAHIQRGDFGANLLSEALALPLAWHPALYPLKAILRQAREAACDQLAAQEMISPTAYAQCLVALARKSIAPPSSPVMALPMFGAGPLEQRVKGLMAADRRSRFSGACDAGLSLAVLAAVAAPALLLHVTPSFASERAVTRISAEPEPAPAAAVAPRVPAAPAPARPSPAAAEGPDDSAVITDAHGRHYRHSWTTHDGRKLTVYTDQAAEPSPAEQRRIEAQLEHARAAIEKARGDIARARVDIDAQMARSRVQLQASRQQLAASREKLDGHLTAAAELAIARAEARLNDPELQKKIARAAAVASSPEIQRKLDTAAAALRDPEHHRLILEEDADPEP